MRKPPTLRESLPKSEGVILLGSIFVSTALVVYCLVQFFAAVTSWGADDAPRSVHGGYPRLPECEHLRHTGASREWADCVLSRINERGENE